MPVERYQVVITGAAEADLGEIEDYWTQRGEAWRGDQYAQDLPEVANRELTAGPAARRGRSIPVPGHTDARALLVFGVYRIIYRIDEAAGVVNVLRFWHAHRDKPPLS